MIHGVYTHPQRINRSLAHSLLERANMNVKYDPVLHNAVNVRFINEQTRKTGDGSFLIFESGKIIITGGHCVQAYEKRFMEIMNILDPVACYVKKET